MATPAVAVLAGRYRLVRQLGAGGMGRVWLAHDEQLDRDVALKELVLGDDMPAPERERAILRARREARAIAQFDHPHVVRLHGVEHTDAGPWIVMEYVPSRSLQQVINDGGGIEPARAAAIGLAVLDAL